MIRSLPLRILSACLALLACGRAHPAWGADCPLTLPAAAQRTTVLISDLHLGLGRVDNPLRWHPYEDFRWTEEFGRFLLAIDREGASQVDLVLNGDSFELWQSDLEKDCVHDDRNLGCSGTEALARAQEVFAAHHEDLVLLRDFAGRGTNRVFFVPGNHDAALLYEPVASALLTAIGAPEKRVAVLRQGYYLSDDCWIYAEHGHQLDELNKFTHWPDLFLTAGQMKYLEQPWGQAFVHSFYDFFEAKYPIIDNIEGELNGIRYGLASEGVGGSAFALGKFAKFYLFETSLRQLARTLGPEKPGEAPKNRWDVKAERKKGDAFFLASIPADDPIRPIVAGEIEKHQLGVSIDELSDEDIADICDSRAALIADHQSVEYCTAAQLSALVGALTDPRGNRTLVAHLGKVRRALAESGRTGHSFAVAVISHTHKALPGFDPNQGKTTEWHPTVYNTGAWQRTVTRAKLEKRRQEKGWSIAQVLTEQRLEDLPPCYPAVVIPRYTQRPNAALRYWQRGGDGVWSFAAQCPSG